MGSLCEGRGFHWTGPGGPRGLPSVLGGPRLAHASAGHSEGEGHSGRQRSWQGPGLRARGDKAAPRASQWAPLFSGGGGVTPGPPLSSPPPPPRRTSCWTLGRGGPASGVAPAPECSELAPGAGLRGAGTPTGEAASGPRARRPGGAGGIPAEPRRFRVRGRGGGRRAGAGRGGGGAGPWGSRPRPPGAGTRVALRAGAAGDPARRPLGPSAAARSSGWRGLPLVPGPERLLASGLQLRVLRLLLRDLLPAVLLPGPEPAHHREAAEALPGLQVGAGPPAPPPPALSRHPAWAQAGLELQGAGAPGAAGR